MADSVYYDVLGLKRSSTDSDIKNAFRAMALKWHPDKHEAKAKQLAEQKFRQIAEAYTVLSDPKRRARYDQYGASAEGGAGWTLQVNPQTVFSDFFGSDSPFADLIGENIFVDSQNSKPKQMAPLEVNLYLSLEELALGAQKNVKVTRQVIADDRSGTKAEETIFAIDVKPGWKEGTKLTFPSAGDEGLDSQPGDVVFTIREKPHPHFVRRKNDIVYTANISLLEALVGSVVTVGTFDGRSLSIPITDIVSPGTVKIVPGEGMPFVKNPDVKGNLIIEFVVKYPTSLTLKQKEQLETILPM